MTSSGAIRPSTTSWWTTSCASSTAVKKVWGDRVTTVFPRQGQYAHDARWSPQYPPRRPDGRAHRRPARSTTCPHCSRADPRPSVREGDTMKATQQLHDLGQSLWLDNITRDLLDERHAQALHRRVVGDRAHVESDDLRPGDQEQRRLRRRDPREAQATGKSGEALFFELALEDITAGRRPLPADLRADQRRGRLGVARGVAAARLRHGEHARRGEGAARPRRRGPTSSSRFPARRKGCRRSRRRSSPACRST